jgi:hypothetical protein
MPSKTLKVHLELANGLTQCGARHMQKARLTKDIEAVQCDSCISRHMPHRQSGLGVLRCSVCGRPYKDHRGFARCEAQGKESNYGK